MSHRIRLQLIVGVVTDAPGPFNITDDEVTDAVDALVKAMPSLSPKGATTSATGRWVAHIPDMDDSHPRTIN